MGPVGWGAVLQRQKDHTQVFQTPGSVHSLIFLGLLQSCYLLLTQNSVGLLAVPCGLWDVAGHQWMSLPSVINS